MGTGAIFVKYFPQAVGIAWTWFITHLHLALPAIMFLFLIWAVTNTRRRERERIQYRVRMDAMYDRDQEKVAAAEILNAILTSEEIKLKVSFVVMDMTKKDKHAARTLTTEVVTKLHELQARFAKLEKDAQIVPTCQITRLCAKQEEQYKALAQDATNLTREINDLCSLQEQPSLS